MLSKDKFKEYIKKTTSNLRDPDAPTSKINSNLKELFNMFHALLVIKQNGNFGMLEGVIFQFQVTLQQLPQDMKPEHKQKLRELFLKYSESLEIIAENLGDLESGSMIIFNALSVMFLCVEKLFKLRDLITTYPRQPSFPPM